MHKQLIESVIDEYDERQRIFTKYELTVIMQNLADRMQASIDLLMLEHCPEEMTEEQLENWELHQIPVSKDQYNDVCRKLGFPVIDYL